jgi:hypothetical protein
MVFFSASTPLPTPALTPRHYLHGVVAQSASSQSNALSSSNDSTARVATGFTHDFEDVLEDHHRTSTNATSTTTTGRGSTRRSAVLTMMSPIQLQDVARKQFEDRERRRAQQVRPGLRFPKRNPTQHFFFQKSFLRILYYDSLLTRGFCLSPHTTPGGRPAARLSLGPFPTSESRENVVQ